jgi:hypothetical protein
LNSAATTLLAAEGANRSSKKGLQGEDPIRWREWLRASTAPGSSSKPKRSTPALFGPKAVFGYEFTALSVEHREGMRLIRSIGAEGNEGSFLFSKKGATPQTATITPQKPFTGAAEYVKEKGVSVVTQNCRSVIIEKCRSQEASASASSVVR